MNNKHVCKCILCISLITCLCMAVSGKNRKDQPPEKDKPIIEEVVVTGKTPAQQPVSQVSLIKKKEIDVLTPKNLGDIINLSSGVYATEGAKNETSIKVRGLASNRITLMLDGIPIYEPYFNSFDLKTVATAGIENVKLIKGAGSVLYGANTLGGVVNVVTLRPDQPFFNLKTSASADNTYFISGSGGASWKNLSVYANATVDNSDGFKWNNNGNRELRLNSDYNRVNLSGKIYFTPFENSQIMAQVMYNTSDYGIPAATEYVKERIWRFTDWQRLQLNLGGTFPMFGKGILKIRTYFVHHYNVLDQYRSFDFAETAWESTYKNNSLGAVLSGNYPLTLNQELKFSVNFNSNRIQQQGDVGEEWDSFKRRVFSAGVEDHWKISDHWKVVAGIGMDHLHKDNGESVTRINPIAGIKYDPNPWLGMHLSFAQKSRFPSMKSLYGSRTGNPELEAEIGDMFEVGFTYKKNIRVSGALFYQNIRDMIQAYRGLDGYKAYQNVGRAEIYGAEIEVRKRFEKVETTFNYTYLNASDRDAGQPLDYTPENQINAIVRIGDFSGFSLTLWGIGVSKSQAQMGKTPPFDIISIPGYVTANVIFEKKFRAFRIYVKGENLFNEFYFTEPGYPMKSRCFSLGFDLDVRKYR